MSFIDFDCGDALEPVAVPEGEYLVEILEATLNEEKHYIRVLMRIAGPSDKVPANASDFSHFLYLPKPDDEPRKINTKKLGRKRFCDAFDLPSGGIYLETLPGRTAWALLRHEDNEEYGPQNSIKKFVATS